MKITAIRTQRRSEERVNIDVDGEFRLALAHEIVVREGLRPGDVVDEARLARLEAADQRWKAREASLELLSYRARSARELERRLRRKDVPEDVAKRTVAELEERGLVDDAAFAESFIRDRVRLRPKGRRRLVQELRARGVDVETAEAAVGGVMEMEDVSELELAREAARRWSPRPHEDPRSARRRLYGYLARRGFGTDAIRVVMEEKER